MQYEIICEPNPNKLTVRVNERIRTGWKPIGGVCASNWFVDGDGVNCEYCQALIKESNTANQTTAADG